MIIQNKPGTLIAMIPQLSAGNYTVKIVTQSGASGYQVKNPRICLYNKTLVVE